jgi:hypothetical protein
MNIISEAFVVGIVIAILGFIISLAFMYLEDANFSLAKYTFWKSVLFSNFLTGFIGHLFFQYVGINRYYCKYGVACKK